MKLKNSILYVGIGFTLIGSIGSIVGMFSERHSIEIFDYYNSLMFLGFITLLVNSRLTEIENKIEKVNEMKK